jgi:glucose/arabinose dehydrogenase
MAAALLIVCPPRAGAQQLQARLHAAGLSLPVAIVPDPLVSDRLFVVEKAGVIRIVWGSRNVLAEPFLDIRDKVATLGEQGLLGMAIDPGYAANRRFYVFYTRDGTADEYGDLVVARYRRSAGNQLVADPTEFRFRWGAPNGPDHIEHSEFSNHNGGNLQFGPDGQLYIGTGDGGAGDDPHHNAQDPGSLLGKMLRIDVSVGDGDPQGYRVPADNPFVDSTPVAARPEIWAFGLRNPWRFSFDDPSRGGTGALIIGDVGQGRFEEVDYEPAGQGGRNYGWRNREGAHDHVVDRAPAYVPLTEPAFEYAHTVGVSPVEGFSITGGYVYRGAALGAFWRGRYFFADFPLARIWSAAVAPGTGAFSDIIEHTSAFGTGNVSSFGADVHGEIYVASLLRGAIYKLCEYTVTPGVTAFAAGGGSGTVAVTASSACDWDVSQPAPWLALITNGTERGSKTVVFRAIPNPTPSPRSAVLTVAGHTVTLTQSAAPSVLGDIDGNGAGDLLWQHADGRLAAWLMAGSVLADGRPLGPGAVADPRWRLAAAGDFDGDGSRDVLFQHADGSLGIWFMAGTAQLTGRALIPARVADTNWMVRAAGDMNRDGFADIIWQNQTTGQLAVWTMEGPRQIAGRLLTPGAVADPAWQIVGTADVNRDGHTDLVWWHRTSGAIAAWLMNGPTLVSGQPFSPGVVSDVAWTIGAVADLNGDGSPDLIWQNRSTGLLGAWLMNGLARIGEGVRLTPAEVPDTGWRLASPR